MDKIKAFMTDKKNTPIVGAVAGIVLILVVLFYLKQFGIIGGGGGGDYTADTGTGTTDTMSAPADTPPTSGPQPVTPDQAASGGAAAPGGGAAPAPATPVDKMPPMLAYRKDPFMSSKGLPTPRDALMTILPSVRHPRLLPASISLPAVGPDAAEAPETLPPQPLRRVAGIMWGSKVKAIIESNGKTYVKMPGETIPEERVRVERIEPTGVILTTLDTRRPMSIRVNLAGSLAPQDGSMDNSSGTEAPPPRGGSGGRPSGGNNIEAPPPGFQ